jgi:hypothetical protein
MYIYIGIKYLFGCVPKVHLKDVVESVNKVDFIPSDQDRTIGKRVELFSTTKKKGSSYMTGTPVSLAGTNIPHYMGGRS